MLMTHRAPFEVLDDRHQCHERASYVLKTLLLWVNTLDLGELEFRIARFVMCGNLKRGPVSVAVVAGWLVKHLHFSKTHRACRGHWQALIDALLTKTGSLRQGDWLDPRHPSVAPPPRVITSLLQFLMTDGNSSLFRGDCFSLYDACNDYCMEKKIYSNGPHFYPAFGEAEGLEWSTDDEDDAEDEGTLHA